MHPRNCRGRNFHLSAALRHSRRSRVCCWLAAGVWLALAPASGWAVTFTTDTLITGDDFTYDGEDVVVDGCTVTIDGAHEFNSLTVQNSGIVTHSQNETEALYALYLTITGDVVVTADSRINVTGRGYAALAGPGAGGSTNASGGGGAYGGDGGRSPESAGGAGYGSFAAPTELGSGGGVETDATTGRAGGGGAVRLMIAGNLVVEGQILANGQNATVHDHGGGSGGSIWIDAGTLSGTGVIRAQGGNRHPSYTGGGGGGGRVALYVGTYGFTGSLTACGGEGHEDGGAGSVYIDAGDDVGDGLYLDNCAVVGADTPLPGETVVNNHLSVSNGAILRQAGVLDIHRTLTIAAGSVLTHAPAEAGLTINVAGGAVIAAGAKIDLTGRGYPANTGPGAGGSTANSGGGGGYGGEGGYGGDSGAGGAYGSFTEPTELGSGGGVETDAPSGRAAGGGAVRMSVSGALLVEGEILANGGNATNQDHGGGSGGSIWIDAASLGGAGVIHANGGTRYGSYTGGGGGGGRIALYVGTYGFTGSLTACGGEGYQDGGAGSIYIDAVDDAGDGLYLDNCAVVGADTPMSAGTVVDNHLTVSNGARLRQAGTLDVQRTLTLAAGGILWHAGGEAGLTVNVASDAVIAADGKIDVTGCGHPANAGPGTGGSTAVSGGGGGYGGEGGYASDAGGGSAYGSFTEPTELGSGGGVETNVTYGRAAGGGAVRLSVAGALLVDGQILANGGNATEQDHGGGSGGSIWIDAASLGGGGAIQASGGTRAGASYDGGGGAGGRIALYLDTYDFNGAVTACGGEGYQDGGAGTVYVEAGAGRASGLWIDACGVVGADTPLAAGASVPHALFLRGVALVRLSGLLGILGDLDISDATLTHATMQTDAHVNVTGNVFIQPTGKLDVTGRGHASRSGPGRGGDGPNYGGGGGHGGYGGRSSDAGSGGVTYGTTVHEPVEFGSGGGGDDDGFAAPGGAGGGALRLTVGGTLTVEGQLRADGKVGGVSGGEYGGGGAGGSLWIETNALAGAGVISASGGNGGNASYAGGGGGGRVAIYYTTDTFAGQLSASGGDGYVDGGAGTILRMGPGNTLGALTVTNAGTAGAITDLPAPPVPFDSIALADGAIFDFPGATTLEAGRFDILPGGVLRHRAAEAGLTVLVSGDMNIAAGGAIDLRLCGFPRATGPGAGVNGPDDGSGAGHGGRGGNSSHGGAGGAVYGSLPRPSTVGSGGGSDTDGPSAPGGTGGGAVRIDVAGTLTVDGPINADGQNGITSGGESGGGGSGGSLWIMAGTLAGTSTISANGGNGGTSGGGGGGGGRIAIYTCDLLFDPASVTATGGTGWQAGQPGTVFFGSDAIEITQHPASLVAFPDETAVFSVIATTTEGTLMYRWRKNGVELSDDGRITGTATDELSIAVLTPDDTGYYDVLLTDECGIGLSDAAHLVVPPLGDMNCDGVINALDINPFVIALTNPALYGQQFPHCRRSQGDCNGDDAVNALDINPFVRLLTGG